MGRLTIEDLPDELLARLERKAAQTGRSIGDIAREALMTSVGEEAAAPERPSWWPALEAFWREAEQRNGGQMPVGAVEDLIAERRSQAERE